MKKRLLCAALCLAVCFLTARAEISAPRAALTYDTAVLEKYETFTMDAKTGLWSAGDPLFGALEDAVAQNEARNLLNDGALLWQLRLTGNAKTGTIAPALEFVFLAREPIGVRAVSIIVGGRRYDCAVTAEQTAFGGAPAERFLAPLNADTLALPGILAAEGQATILLHGRQKIYTSNVVRGAENGQRERLEGLCPDCLRLRDEMEEMGAAAYRLWDLTAAEAGGAPNWRQTDLTAESEYAAMLPGPGRTLSVGTRADAVIETQRLLRANGFYAGADEQPYGAKTAAAVLRAQRYYGLAETGSVDEGLLACLNGNAPAPVPAAEAAEPASLSTAKITLTRWWCAGSAAAKNAAAGLGALECADVGDRFCIVEGVLRNEGETELGLGWQLTARVIVDGKYAYDCTVRVENGAADGFLTALAPQGEGRLLLLAEIPAAALEAAQTIGVAVSLGGETLTCALTE